MADKFDEMARAMIAKAAKRSREDWQIDIAILLRSADSAAYARCREDASRLLRECIVTANNAPLASGTNRIMQAAVDAILALPTSTDGASHG